MGNSQHATMWRVVTLSVALLLVTTAAVAPVAAHGSEASTSEQGTDSTRQAQSALDDVQRTLERVDDFLETVVDLVETVSKLTGEGEAAGGD